MKRFIDEKLLKWKESIYRKPLIVRGGRQVGKTYSISEFGRKHFKEVLVFDFEKEKKLHKIFDDTLAPHDIIERLEVHTKKVVDLKNTLLFFDEIQACPEALLSLRYFYEEMPEVYIIAAGSLLEFAMGDLSFPVGRVDFEWMRPLSFSEFLHGLDVAILDKKRIHSSSSLRYSDSIHDEIMEYLKLYFIVGGMPEAVKKYCETTSLVHVAQVHKSLIQSFMQSFLKYRDRIDVHVLETVLEKIPTLVGSQIKYRSIDPEIRTEKIRNSLQVLERALIINKVHATSAQGIPLGAGASSKIFKTIFIDIGLMQYFCGIDSASIIHEKDLMKVYKGALAEQFVGQELLVNSDGSENDKLYYWSRFKKNSSAEVDYLFVKKGKVIPLEVKSGPSGKLKSLHLFLKEHPETEQAIVLNSNNRSAVDGDDKIAFMPLYTIVD